MPEFTAALGILLSLMIGLYASIWIHEFGHCLGGIASGIRITSVGTGVGGWVLWVRVRGIAFYLATRLPFQGMTFARIHGLNSRRSLAIFFGGGILANLIAAGVAFAIVGYCPPHPWLIPVWVLGACNALLGIGNLVPLQFRVNTAVLPSDGAVLFSLRKAPMSGVPFALAVNLLRSFSGLWQAIEDRTMLSTMSLMAAHGWVERKNIARAAELLAEAERYWDNPSQTDRLIANHVRVWVAVSEGRVADAEKVSDDSLGLLQGPSFAASALATEIDRAEYLFKTGDHERAKAVLDRLPGHPSFDDPYCHTAWRAVAYCAGMIEEPPETLPPDQPEQRLWLQTLLMERALSQNDWQTVAVRSQIVLDSLKQLSRALAAIEDKVYLRPLLDHYRGLLVEAGHRVAETIPKEIPESQDLPDESEVEGQELRLYFIAIFGLFAGYLSLAVTGLVSMVMSKGLPDDRRLAVPLMVYIVIGGLLGVGALCYISILGWNRYFDRTRHSDYGRR